MSDLKTREQWLAAATEKLDSVLAAVELKRPEKLQLSVGFPKTGAGSTKTAIGQCWSPEMTADGTVHIFICPTMSSSLLVLAVLLHELVHAAVGHECGHRGPFHRAMRKLGYTGRVTHTSEEELTDELKASLNEIIAALPAYPHSAIQPRVKPVREKSLNIVLRSVVEEDYKIGMQRDLFEEKGPPLCPDGKKMVPVRE